MTDEKLLDRISGNTGGAAVKKETRAGLLVSVSVAVTMKYGKEEDQIMRWVNCAVWDERREEDQDDELSPWQERVLDKIDDKGMKVVAEGYIKAKKVDGKTVYDMTVKRIGLVDWVQRGDSSASSTKRKRTSSRQESDDDGEEPSGW